MVYKCSECGNIFIHESLNDGAIVYCSFCGSSMTRIVTKEELKFISENIGGYLEKKVQNIIEISELIKTFKEVCKKNGF